MTRRLIAFVCFIVVFISAPRAQSVRRARIKTRMVQVTVTDSMGRPLTGATIQAVDAKTKQPLAGQAYKVGTSSTKMIVVQTKPPAELVVSAPGRGRQSVAIEDWKQDYYFVLMAPLPAVGSSTTVPTPAAVIKKTRSISVIIEDDQGRRVRNAEVTLLNAGTKDILEKKLFENGFGAFEVSSAPGTRLRLVASGQEVLSAGLPVSEAADYVFKLKSKRPPVMARTVTVSVEGLDGARVADAEVRVLNATTGKAVVPWTLLRQGFGPVQYKSDGDVELRLEARAPGRIESQTPFSPGTASLVVKLKRRSMKARYEVTVSDREGKPLPDAVVNLMGMDGNSLARAETGKDGRAELGFVFRDYVEARLEVSRGGYKTRITPVRLAPSRKLAVALSPDVPRERSSLVIVLVMSKGFQRPASTYLGVKQGLKRILDECTKTSKLWASVGAYALGNQEVRDILPFTRNLNEHLVEEAEDRLRDLNPYSSALSWRDLEALTRFLQKTRQIGRNGCDILMIAPKNMAMMEDESLYEAGGEDTLDKFRAQRLRLRLIEVGLSDARTQAYQEFCEGSFGFYASVSQQGNLANKLARVQFHYPTPPR